MECKKVTLVRCETCGTNLCPDHIFEHYDNLACVGEPSLVFVTATCCSVELNE